jgi:hypothetical protein
LAVPAPANLICRWIFRRQPKRVANSRAEQNAGKALLRISAWCVSLG